MRCVVGRWGLDVFCLDLARFVVEASYVLYLEGGR
jgi:hypothetical protein